MVLRFLKKTSICILRYLYNIHEAILRIEKLKCKVKKCRIAQLNRIKKDPTVYFIDLIRFNTYTTYVSLVHDTLLHQYRTHIYAQIF